MKVFIKRFPSKGEFPETAGYYDTNVGRVFYVNEKFDRPKKYYPIWWLQEIELPNAEDIRGEALGPFKEKDLEDQYGDFIQDDVNTFTKGANYILNHLKQK